eukprot:m51a1_g4220 hypothetical protein (263) ;mRNA; f:88855-89833
MSALSPAKARPLRPSPKTRSERNLWDVAAETAAPALSLASGPDGQLRPSTPVRGSQAQLLHPTASGPAARTRRQEGVPKGPGGADPPGLPPCIVATMTTTGDEGGAGPTAATCKRRTASVSSIERPSAVVAAVAAADGAAREAARDPRVGSPLRHSIVEEPSPEHSEGSSPATPVQRKRSVCEGCAMLRRKLDALETQLNGATAGLVQQQKQAGELRAELDRERERSGELENRVFALERIVNALQQRQARPPTGGSTRKTED